MLLSHLVGARPNVLLCHDRMPYFVYAKPRIAKFSVKKVNFAGFKVR